MLLKGNKFSVKTEFVNAALANRKGFTSSFHRDPMSLPGTVSQSARLLLSGWGMEIRTDGQEDGPS